ncbi:hypothetical protein BDV95DRAFT_627423 [Massariosphaeria phaeospora]|uniref:Zn(2)-C6 fungal-type domain-containing protein n=1 Tax=Massariosphaeria phaeospora TaxID=100035 RepID=A0A7C8MCW3_9PLEO|nr:hypothetical protein BDV95DRAFT_627423 [Massariosphaeria phaeospora]
MSTFSGSASNASPPALRLGGANALHTRTYQACIPCRRRKVRCDLGPVDNPHDPPCVRCRRESKECFFSATRRKRKQDSGDDDDFEAAPVAVDDYEVRNGRKRAKPDPFEVSPITPVTANAYVSQPLTPGGSVGRLEPLRRPVTATNAHAEDDDPQVNNATAAILQQSEVYSGHDALNLLFEAAGRNGDIERHHRTGSASSLHRPILGAGSTPNSQTNFASPQTGTTRGFHHRQSQSRTVADQAVDPAISQQPPAAPGPPINAAYIEAVKAWSRFRFCRAGWLTAKEAIAYIDYFYTFLSPLTPIVVPDYRDYSSHAKFLKQEPMLVMTLLTIASRFAPPNSPNPAGAVSRSRAIHGQFWPYLQGMIARVIYGQEQFGGGFCGAGQQPGSDINPLSRKGLRTLGTVESLMLLTEWHPRALHFPPGNDDDELVPPDDVFDVESAANLADPASDLYKADEGQRIDSWLEPCWRSDRMCWMLLGNATSLAFEIGVFDDTSELEFEEANQHLSHATVKAYYRRKNHLKDLLVIYVTQTSGRLGLASMLPKVEQETELTPQKTPNERYQERISQIKAPPPQFGMRADGQRLPLESIATQERNAVQDLVLDFWTRIAKIMEMGNLKLFPNRRQTRELLKSGEYEELLKQFQTPLLDWKRCFDSAPQVPTQLRHVLTIEYEYTRVYLNSLALQAVVERCTHNTPLQSHAQPNGTSAPHSGGDGNAIPFSTLVKMYGNDRYYINEVIESSRNVLRILTEGLYPGEALRHAPVRTFFRIVSVAIILLKTFALGATEDDVAYSLGLLDRAVEALRTSIVDDVHVGNRFADLVETLTQRIRSRFVRLAANGSTGISRAGSRSPPRAGAQTPMMPPPNLLPQQNPLGPSYGGMSYQGIGTSIPGSPSLGISASGRATPNHPLWGITNETYDMNSNSISIMPPPGFNSNGYNWQQQAPPWGRDNNYEQDWLALPLDPLFNQYGADINQTAMGPDVGGMDMLDILLNMGGPPGSA